MLPSGNGGCTKTSAPLSSGSSKQLAPVPPAASSPVAVPSNTLPPCGTSSSSSSSGSEDATAEKSPSPQKTDAATAAAAATQVSGKTKKVWASMKWKTVACHA